jgi:hypothetical protein
VETQKIFGKTNAINREKAVKWLKVL